MVEYVKEMRGLSDVGRCRSSLRKSSQQHRFVLTFKRSLLFAQPPRPGTRQDFRAQGPSSWNEPSSGPAQQAPRQAKNVSFESATTSSARSTSPAKFKRRFSIKTCLWNASGERQVEDTRVDHQSREDRATKMGVAKE